jgi:hypothetical protein
MDTATSSTNQSDRNDLSSMLATLCSYENLFGPYHPQTLLLMAQAADACWRAGELACARQLLERAARDLGRFLGTEHDLSLRAVAALRDLLIAQRDYERAAAVQRELLEYLVRRLGTDHSETLAARAELGKILLENVPRVRAGNTATM